ncbi:hypothetical protein KBC75_02570 [Candidatus Shapirobacteria bacterium]|nr:hypothetical protein [Candidatus Shapirobacteria bacterium]
MNPAFLSAIFLQISGTLGAGIFTLPYVFVHSNIFFASVFFLFLILITASLNQFYGEIVLSTPGRHQLAGYAQTYLGKKFKRLATLNLLLLAIGATTAYQKLFSSFLVILFPGFDYSVITFFELSILWFIFSQSRSRSPLWHSFLSILLVLVPLFLFVFSISNSSFVISNLSYSPNFLFYGPAIFALSGFTIIPEIKSKFLPQASLYGLFITSLIYLLFIFSIIRLSPTGVSSDSLTGIFINYPNVAKYIAFFGLLVTFQATQNFLLVVKELFFHDLAFSAPVSNIFSLIVLLSSVLLNPISLVLVLSLTGHITIFISALLICLIRFRLPHNFLTEFKLVLVILCFTAGLLAAFI